MNVSKWDIVVRKIKVFPKVLDIAHDDSAEAINDASHDVPFEPFLLPAGATYDFPLGIRPGDDARRFMLIVSWRSARSTCLPKVPVFMFSSIRAILDIDRQKAWRE